MSVKNLKIKTIFILLCCLTLSFALAITGMTNSASVYASQTKKIEFINGGDHESFSLENGEKILTSSGTQPTVSSTTATVINNSFTGEQGNAVKVGAHASGYLNYQIGLGLGDFEISFKAAPDYQAGTNATNKKVSFLIRLVVYPYAQQQMTSEGTYNNTIMLNKISLSNETLSTNASWQTVSLKISLKQQGENVSWTAKPSGALLDAIKEQDKSVFDYGTNTETGVSTSFAGYGVKRAYLRITMQDATGLALWVDDLSMGAEFSDNGATMPETAIPDREIITQGNFADVPEQEIVGGGSAKGGLLTLGKLNILTANKDTAKSAYITKNGWSGSSALEMSENYWYIRFPSTDLPILGTQYKFSYKVKRGFDPGGSADAKMYSQIIAYRANSSEYKQAYIEKNTTNVSVFTGLTNQGVTTQMPWATASSMTDQSTLTDAFTKMYNVDGYFGKWETLSYVFSLQANEQTGNIEIHIRREKVGTEYSHVKFIDDTASTSGVVLDTGFKNIEDFKQIDVRVASSGVLMYDDISFVQLPTNFDTQITVTDLSGKPINGAKVKIPQQDVATDNGGITEFTTNANGVAIVRSGFSTTCTASANGYISNSFSINPTTVQTEIKLEKQPDYALLNASGNLIPFGNAESENDIGAETELSYRVYTATGVSKGELSNTAIIGEKSYFADLNAQGGVDAMVGVRFDYSKIEFGKEYSFSGWTKTVDGDSSGKVLARIVVTYQGYNVRTGSIESATDLQTVTLVPNISITDNWLKFQSSFYLDLVDCREFGLDPIVLSNNEIMDKMLIVATSALGGEYAVGMYYFSSIEYMEIQFQTLHSKHGSAYSDGYHFDGLTLLEKYDATMQVYDINGNKIDGATFMVEDYRGETKTITPEIVDGMYVIKGLVGPCVVTPVVTGLSLNSKTLTADDKQALFAPDLIVKIDSAALNIKVNEVVNLSHMVIGSDGVNSIMWTSSDYSIVSVNANGAIKGISTGTATITLSVGDKTATCVVTVTSEDEEGQPLPEPLPPQGNTDNNSGCSSSITIGNAIIYLVLTAFACCKIIKKRSEER